MQEKQLFEYAVIRVVPHVEREEFINVGVIVFCAAQHFLEMKFEVNEERLLSFSATIDIPELQQRLVAFSQITNGLPNAGTIAALPKASRFRWLTATRSTIVQTSAVHPGFCADPNAALEKLFMQLVQ